MAYASFPNLSYWKVLATGEMPHGGGFTLRFPMRLMNVVLTIYKHGAHAGTERMRVKIFHDASRTKLYATSDWVTVDSFAELHDYWQGRVRFDFTGKPALATTQRYYVAVETDGYARDGGTRYLSLMLDWPMQSSIQEDAPYYSWKVEFYGERRITP
jgi:hypothetical protein